MFVMQFCQLSALHVKEAFWERVNHQLMSDNVCFSLKSRFCQVFGKVKLDNYLHSGVARLLPFWSGWSAVITSRFLSNAHWVHILVERHFQSLPLDNKWEYLHRAVELPRGALLLSLSILVETWLCFSQDSAGVCRAGAGCEGSRWRQALLHSNQRNHGKHLTYLCLHLPFVKQGNYNLPALYACWEGSLMFVNHFEDGVITHCCGRWKISGPSPSSLFPGSCLRGKRKSNKLLLPVPFPIDIEYPRVNLLTLFPKFLCSQFYMFSSQPRKH